MEEFLVLQKVLPDTGCNRNKLYLSQIHEVCYLIFVSGAVFTVMLQDEVLEENGDRGVILKLNRQQN